MNRNCVRIIVRIFLWGLIGLAAVAADVDDVPEVAGDKEEVGILELIRNFGSGIINRVPNFIESLPALGPILDPAKNQDKFDILLGMLEQARTEADRQNIIAAEQNKFIHAFVKQQFELLDSKDLLNIISAAYFLGLDPMVEKAIKIWIEKYSLAPSEFLELTPDLKEKILRKILPAHFIDLADANKWKQSVREEQFKWALKFYYKEISKIPGSAEGLFRDHVFGKFVRLPAPVNSQDSLEQGEPEVVEIMDAAVTQDQFVRIMGTNPLALGRGYHRHFRKVLINGAKVNLLYGYAVEGATYQETLEYAEALGQRDPDYDYLLPKIEHLRLALSAPPEKNTLGEDEKEALEWSDPRFRANSYPERSKMPNSLHIHHSYIRQFSSIHAEQQSALICTFNSKWCIGRYNKYEAHTDTWGNCVHEGYRHEGVGFRLIRVPKIKAIESH